LSVLSYLRLYRASIALTPAADVALGFAVMAAIPEALRPVPPRWELLAPASLVSILVFCSAVSLNDLLDAEKDRRAAPNRPIPSGEVSRVAALAASAAAALLALGTGALLGLYPLLAAAVVLALTLSYNVLSRRIDSLGVVNLGLVRAADLLFGMVCAGLPSYLEQGALTPVLIPAVLYALYVVFLSAVALEERREAPRRKRLILFSLMAVGVSLLFALRAAGGGLAADGVIGLCLICLILPVALFFLQGEKPVEALVGHFISATFLLAAMTLSGKVDAAAGAGLLILFVISRLLAGRFPPS